MKKALSVFFLSTLLLTACGQTVNPPPPNQEALKNEWQLAFYGSLVSYFVCDNVLKTAEELQQGEIDSSDAEFEISIQALFLEANKEGLGKWETSNVVAPYKEKIEADIDTLEDLMGQLPNGEIITQEIPDEVEGVCTSFSNTLEEMAIVALDAGMTEETMEELTTEINESFQGLLP